MGRPRGRGVGSARGPLLPAAALAARDLGGPVVEIQRARARRWTGAVIAEVGLSRATVARTLRQLGLARLPAAEAPPVGRRYEWERPGQLLHVDIKKLGRIGGIGHRITGDRRQRVRGIGWEFVHVCIDDCSRVAHAEVLSDERSITVAGFRRRAVAWFARRGVVAQRAALSVVLQHRRFESRSCTLRGLSTWFPDIAPSAISRKDAPTLKPG